MQGGADEADASVVEELLDGEPVVAAASVVAVTSLDIGDFDKALDAPDPPHELNEIPRITSDAITAFSGIRSTFAERIR